MQIKDIAEFMAGIARYYGGFPNDFVKDLYAEELAYIKPSDYSRLFTYIISNNPATWRPDVKALKDGIKALRIDTLLEPGLSRKCPVCGTTSTSTGVCPECKYAGPSDGTPEEYRKWHESWKAGREPVYDVSEILRTLAQKANAGKPGGRS
jgi:hypothetical protein